jgi:ABC-type antimicrobial peptide transport system permease subunit
MTATNLVVRTTRDVPALASVAAAQVRRIDPGVRLLRAVRFADILDGPLARPRFAALLLTVFGAAALFLTTIGLYAVLAASVRRRDRDIAVRVAFGATPAKVRRLVFGETGRLIGAGALIGVAAASASMRLVTTMLFEVNPFDLVTTISVGLLLGLAAALASYLPVRRATRLDPVALLRSS